MSRNSQNKSKIKPRNLFAEAAWFKTSSGPMYKSKPRTKVKHEYDDYNEENYNLSIEQEWKITDFEDIQDYFNWIDTLEYVMKYKTFETPFQDIAPNDRWNFYEQCLRAHDWTYKHSNDHRVWSAGHKQKGYITALKRTMYKLNKGKANQLYYKHSIFHNEDGTFK